MGWTTGMVGEVFIYSNIDLRTWEASSGEAAPDRICMGLEDCALRNWIQQAGQGWGCFGTWVLLGNPLADIQNTKVYLQWVTQIWLPWACSECSESCYYSISIKSSCYCKYFNQFFTLFDVYLASKRAMTGNKRTGHVCAMILPRSKCSNKWVEAHSETLPDWFDARSLDSVDENRSRVVIVSSA